MVGLVFQLVVLTFTIGLFVAARRPEDSESAGSVDP